jgi:hypothetical protein
MSLRNVMRSYGPSLYWPLDALGVTDQSGNGRNGAAAGGITIGGFSGSPIVGGTVSTDFDGTDDRITSTYTPFANGITVTIMGWANRDTSTTDDCLYGTEAAQATYIGLRSGGTNVEFSPQFGVATATTWTAGWPGNAQWVHWAVVFEESANLASLYINGALVSAQTQTGQYNAAPGTFALGRILGVWDFDGKMAHVGVFTRHLYADQIKRIYDVGVYGYATQGWRVRNN